MNKRALQIMLQQAVVALAVSLVIVGGGLLIALYPVVCVIIAGIIIGLFAVICWYESAAEEAEKEKLENDIQKTLNAMEKM